MAKQSAYSTAVLTAQFIGLGFSTKPLPSYEEVFGSSSTSSPELEEQKTKLYEQQ